MVTYDDVYNALSFHSWKTPLQIEEEIAAVRGLSNLVRLTGEPAGYHLRRLVQEGFAESQPRTLTPEQLAARGGRPGSEYRLTSNGIQHQLDLRVETGLEELIPVKA